MKKTLSLIVVSILFLLLSLFTAAAYEEENTIIHHWLLNPEHQLLIILGLCIGIFLVTIFLEPFFLDKHKKVGYYLIAVPVVLASIYLAGLTVYTTAVSESHGPVHYHADYEVWGCQERLKLVQPKWPSDNIGSPLLHVHGDDRIHVEGPVHKFSDINLGNFFRALGGELTEKTLAYPTRDKGIVKFTEGDQCPNGPKGFLAVYVNGKKLPRPDQYIISREETVPPGDCIIVEFGPDLGESTERICESYLAKGIMYEES